jgi:hypothetical protein
MADALLLLTSDHVERPASPAQSEDERRKKTNKLLDMYGLEWFALEWPRGKMENSGENIDTLKMKLERF